MTKEIEKRTAVTPAMQLDNLAGIIKTELENAQKSFLKVGECLCIASDRLAEEGKKASDLITWADENCGIKKAQTYKLMKVYETFGDNSDFAGVSMRVLYSLTSQKEDVVSQARVLAMRGELDSASLNEAIENNKPEPREIKKPAGIPAINGSKSEPIIKKINDDERVQAMAETIKELTDTITALRKEIGEKKPVKPVNSIPFLPQFKSNNMCVRLGLEGGSCSEIKEINKAYRALAKIFTATANKKASEALKEAREALLEAAK